METVDEDAGKVSVETETLLQLPIKLSSPEFSSYWRFGSLADTSGVTSEVPVGGLQQSVVPKL